MRTILILDETSTATLYSPSSYSSYILPSDEVRILLITNHASEFDLGCCLEVAILKTPTTNGCLEIAAFDMHRRYKIDSIYTKQEDLILRAAYLRKALNIKGMQPEEALLFRDKVEMKRHLSSKGISVPSFERVYSPANILAFTATYGFPIIIKPTLGSASCGVKVLKNEMERDLYLETEFYRRIDDKLLDYSGDLIIEAFVEGEMFHINGFARNGILEYVWPFKYLETNLGFTEGKYYGNVSIHRADPLYKPLVDKTQAILSNMPVPEGLMFHLELFYAKGEFLLCEIAARRPGGSIALLIDALEGGLGKFPEMDFRLCNGMALQPTAPIDSRYIVRREKLVVGDVMIPRKVGRLVLLPHLVIPGMRVQNLTKEGEVYKGFDLNTLNTAARLIMESENGDDLSLSLKQGVAEFESQCKYEPVDGSV